MMESDAALTDSCVSDASINAGKNTSGNSVPAESVVLAQSASQSPVMASRTRITSKEFSRSPNEHAEDIPLSQDVRVIANSNFSSDASKTFVQSGEDKCSSASAPTAEHDSSIKPVVPLDSAVIFARAESFETSSLVAPLTQKSSPINSTTKSVSLESSGLFNEHIAFDNEGDVEEGEEGPGCLLSSENVEAVIADSSQRESRCAQCGEVGASMCCVHCAKHFHIGCTGSGVVSEGRDSNFEWSCFSCRQQSITKTRSGDFLTNNVKDGRMKVSLFENSANNVSEDNPANCQGTRHAVGDMEPTGCVLLKGRLEESGEASCSHEGPAADEAVADEYTTGENQRRCGLSEKKEYMATRKRHIPETYSPRARPASPRSLSPSPCQYRRKRRRADNGSVATRCKVNVGPRHQVPALPPFFLDFSCTWDGTAETLAETGGLYSNDAGDTARLVYSPFAMQRVYRKRLAEGATEGIKDADEMNEFIRNVAENWTNKCGWQPFSPEYAYKLLHFAGYDPQRALKIMRDSRFCFTTICDPPQRRYDNKWRPKDRRGQIATTPYPSPLTLRAYLSRKNQHAAAAGAANGTSVSGFNGGIR